MTRADWKLFLVGASALFWELALIRWLGSCVRLVAYYSNFVLIAAFFGLGVGALLGARGELLRRMLLPCIALCICIGAFFSGSFQYNPTTPGEYVWQGAPLGVLVPELSGNGVSFWWMLAIIYVSTAAVFAAFGAWLSELFQGRPPLRAYSAEVAGSLVGVAAFAALSALHTSPPVWFICGSLAVLGLVRRERLDLIAAIAAGGLAIGISASVARTFIWSPYYKISVEPVTSVVDSSQQTVARFPTPVGYALTVNNDYHQMLLDLSRRTEEHPFLASWRELYDAPYAEDASLPPGPILVVGAGTGNDVAAALRRTSRHVDAVEIDPVISQLGRSLHFEHPFDDPRVRLVNEDARTFFQTAQGPYALVVFGFLDSHTLLSSFSSLRLDNFVYTRESMQQVKRLLAPGGAVAVTFASNAPFLHARIIRLLDETFDQPTRVRRPTSAYANGIVYRNERSEVAPAARALAEAPSVEVPTDDWPFLYLQARDIPPHYRVFMGLVVLLAAAALLLLPRGERGLRLPYFFMGVAFFLLETSNVVSLSLLFGSTWEVNLLVFAGILVLVLAGNAATPRLSRVPLAVLLAGSLVAAAVAYAVPTSALLSLQPFAFRAVVAVAVFLGPVFFAALVFGRLIHGESRLAQAYGSNLLGAIVGGAAEYSSLRVGFKALLLVVLACYAATAVLLYRRRA